MPLKTNLKNLTPSRVQYSREIHLLSGGYSCPTAFPEGKITIYPWDSQVADWIIEQRKKATSPREITRGLISQLVNLNGAKIEKFVLGDVSTVLMVSRAIARENKVEFESSCPVCGHVHHESLSIPDSLEMVGKKEPGYAGYDDVTLPICKDVVRIRPLLIEDELNMSQRDANEGLGWVKGLSDHMAAIIWPIVTVGGEKPDNMKELVTWFRALPPRDQEYLEIQELELTPHLDQRVKMTCDQCAHKYVYPLSIDDDFFR